MDGDSKNGSRMFLTLPALAMGILVLLALTWFFLFYDWIPRSSHAVTLKFPGALQIPRGTPITKSSISIGTVDTVTNPNGSMTLVRARIHDHARPVGSQCPRLYEDAISKKFEIRIEYPEFAGAVKANEIVIDGVFLDHSEP